MNIWALCEGQQQIKKISIDAWRVVEAQHILSSRDLVDTRVEHEILEDLLEDSKPTVNKDKNYLLFTPFRYPPLRYGSRFGHPYEPSLWYGSIDLETAFREVAFYRFKFLNDSTSDLGYLEISMTAFTVMIKTVKGVDLTSQPFDQYRNLISNKNNYNHSQPLGAAMREHSVEAFTYFSARTATEAKNVAAYTPSVFQLKKNHSIFNQQTWLCMANKKTIEFTRTGILGKQQFTFLDTSAAPAAQALI